MQKFYNLENKYDRLSISIPNNSLKEYQSMTAIREVLGCLLQDPTLLKQYKITKNDFVEPFHQIIFAAVFNCAKNSFTTLDEYIIEDYLDNFPAHKRVFEKHEGTKYIAQVMEIASMGNFKGNFINLKKWSLLRSLVQAGIDVTEFYDPSDIDIETVELRRERFEENSIDDIIRFYRSKLLVINNIFNMNQGRDSIKAGSEEIEQQVRKWKSGTDFGLSYASNYLTTVTYGLMSKKLTLLSAASGTGKTRISVSNLCHSFVARYWDDKKSEWVINPHGTQNKALYIGTEMELVEEIEPILLAYIADVPQDHIRFGNYAVGEEERVFEAIKILREESFIYLEYVPDYDISTLESVIEEHVTINGVKHIFFDYIHTTTDLINEFQQASKAHMNIREDQVLSNLSLKLKELTRKYNVSIDTCTQVSGDYKNDQNRDATIIRGSKAIVDKIDSGYIVSRPTVKELKLLEPILKSKRHLGKPTPNICLSVYKNRGGRYNNVKIWLWIDYSTMRIHDQFITDYECQDMSNLIPKTYVQVAEDEKVHIFTDKTELQKYSREAKQVMAGINLDADTVIEDDLNSLDDLDDLDNHVKSEDELTEEDKRRLEYHSSSTDKVACLENSDENNSSKENEFELYESYEEFNQPQESIEEIREKSKERKQTFKQVVDDGDFDW